MELSILQDSLAKGLSIVTRATSTRSTLPVLANVLLQTDEDGNLTLAATNLEIVIRARVGAKVNTPGAITLPARTLSDLVNSLPKERIDLELNDQTQTMHLVCGKTETNLKGIDYQEFPLIPEPSDTVATFEASVLKEAINQVSIAAADNDARPVLTGVLFKSDGVTVRLAATDGFRLAIREFPYVGAKFSVVVPVRALQEVARLTDDEPINISFPERRQQIIFDMGRVMVASQLIDGNFPDVDPVIPRKWDTKATVSTLDLRKACKTADVLSKLASNTVTLEVSGDSITIVASSAEMGDNQTTIDATVTGKPIKVNFNVKYLTDALSGSSPQVAIELTRPTEPGVIKPVGTSGYTYVIMPMQVGR